MKTQSVLVHRATCLVAAAAVLAAVVPVWTADYLAEGGDPQRTGWVKDEKIFNTSNVRDMKLWNSGKTITSFVSSAGLRTSAGQVHVATHDGTLYAFGFPLERY